MAVRFPVGYLAVRDSLARDHAESVSSQSKAWGDMHLRVIRRFDELIAQDMPGFTLPAGLREHSKAYAHLKAALEALDDDQAWLARQHIRKAAEWDPATLLHARGMAAVSAAYGGPPTRRAITRLREFESRVRVRYHLNELALRLRAAG
jgi:hypothetical protein